MALSNTKLKKLKKLKNLKGKPKRYEVADEHGMFAEVLSSGSISFRYRYWLNGKKQKVTIGAYPTTSLKRAREIHTEYRALVAEGLSPARKKQADKRTEAKADTLRAFGDAWLAGNSHQPKWQEAQRRWLKVDIYPALGDRKLADINAGDILTLLDSIKARGAPQSALSVRNVLRRLFAHAIGRQLLTVNPAAQIPSKVIHKPVSRDRALSEAEIRFAFKVIDATGAARQSKLAIRLILLTLVRKSELRNAKISDINLAAGEWLIPETKNGKPHMVYLSTQAKAIIEELIGLAGGSEWLIPSVNDATKPMGQSTLNTLLFYIRAKRKAEGEAWNHFAVHDLRRTASTLLHEMGFDPLVVEKALNHTVRGVAGVYNRAQYAEQRRAMLQRWADYIDAVISGANVTPIRGLAA